MIKTSKCINWSSHAKVCPIPAPLTVHLYIFVIAVTESTTALLKVCLFGQTWHESGVNRRAEPPLSWIYTWRVHESRHESKQTSYDHKHSRPKTNWKYNDKWKFCPLLCAKTTLCALWILQMVVDSVQCCVLITSISTWLWQGKKKKKRQFE